METQIFELEQKYWKAMKNHDFETVKGLTHFPCIVAGKNGVHSVDETAFKKMFESGAGSNYKVLDISGIETQKITDDSAIIAYLVEIQSNRDGQNSQMKCACTSTWVKEDDKWMCALHTESELDVKNG